MNQNGSNSGDTKGNSTSATPEIWDVIVIGGGPSGMMAAGRAAELGAQVLVLEKNDSLGKKLLITGGGRCNVTNSEFDTRVLLSKFKENDKFLFSPFSQYGVKETLEFFHNRNMPTKVENEKRTFPASNTAASVLDVLVQYMRDGNVTVHSHVEVKGLITAKSKEELASLANDAASNTSTAPGAIAKAGTITGVRIQDGRNGPMRDIFGRKFILATGGKSRPETGSTGDGFEWAKKLGHTVIEPSASLVPLKIKDRWISQLAGVSMPEVKITVMQHGQKQNKPVKGKILFTHVGVSGPTILNLSKEVGELLGYSDVYLSIDLMPNVDQANLDAMLNVLFRTEINKKLKNCLGLLGAEDDKAGPLPTAIVKAVIELSGVDGETPAHSITKENRRKILAVLKGMPMEVEGLLGIDKAIVTSGGVVLTEIEPKTMQSRLHPNLYLIGDMLHIDRPSGGYSLQLCWTTGYVAGTDAGTGSTKE